MQSLRSKLPDGLGSLPTLSVVLVGLWLLITLLVQLGFSGRLREARDAHHSAASLAVREPLIEVSERHMPVVRAVNPDFENDTVLAFMRKKPAQSGAYSPQPAFEELADHAEAALAGHPYRSLGLVPARLAAPGLLSHVFVHAGLLHVLITIVVFLLAAPLLEARWGPRTLAGVIGLLAVASGGAFALAHGRSDRALIGGGAVVAGLVAAVICRFRDEEVDFLRWLPPPVKLELIAPAWTLGIVWAAYELFLGGIVPGKLPPGIDNAVGYTAHAAGAVLGAGVAYVLMKLGWEQAAARAPVSEAARKRKRAVKRFDLAKVRKARAEGDEDEAFRLLQEECGTSARNRDVVTLYWEMALERGAAEEAAPALERLLQEELRRGAKPVAVGLWKSLNEHAPRHRVAPALLVQLAPAIGEVDGQEGVVLALRQAIDRNDGRLAPELAARIAQWTAEIDPELAGEAAERALESDGLEKKLRAEMEMLVSALAPPETEVMEEAAKPPAPSVFYEESDRSAFGEVGDLSELVDSMFPDGAVTEAVPRALADDHFLIDVAGRGESAVAYSRVRALSIVGIKDLGPKPVVILDVLVDGGGGDRPLGVLRLRCDRFDPKSLIPGAASAKDALRELIGQLAARGNAQPMADITAEPRPPDTIFDTLESYHDQVLKPAGGLLA